ncbi:MAG: hypothetical protein Q9190_002388 [Brigantiaea leucoxantha]
MALKDFMDLEGPDISNHGQATLRDGLICRTARPICSTYSVLEWGNLRIAITSESLDQASKVTERLMKIIGNACSASPTYVAVFSRLCKGEVVTAAKIAILEDLYSAQNADLIQLYLNYQVSNGRSSNLPQTELKRTVLLSKGLHSLPLRENLGPYLVRLIADSLDDMQNELCKRLNSFSDLSSAIFDLLQYRRSIQSVGWLLPMLDTSLRKVNAPAPASGAVKALIALRTTAHDLQLNDGHGLREEIDESCRALIILGSIPDVQLGGIVPILIHTWQQNPSQSQQKLALAVAQLGEVGLDVQRHALADLPFLSEEMSSTLFSIFQGQYREQYAACSEFMRISVLKPIGTHWHWPVYAIFTRMDHLFIEYAIENGVAEWMDLLTNIEIAFHDLMDWFSPSLLRPKLHAWTQRLRSEGLVPVLIALEDSMSHGHALRCFLTGSGCQNDLVNLLKETELSFRRPWFDPVEKIIRMLQSDGGNAKDLTEIVSVMSKMTNKGLRNFSHTLRQNQAGLTTLAEIIAAASLQDPDLNSSDRHAIQFLASCLSPELDLQGTAQTEKLEVAAQYLDIQHAALFAEAQRLENLRLSLNSIRPHEVSRILTKIGIEAPSIVDEIIAALSPPLVDMVRKLGSNQVELQFPVNRLSKLQSCGLGAPDVQGFLVRLIIPNEDLPAGFCIHTYESGSVVETDDHEHSPWVVGEFASEPSEPYCRGLAKRGVYQLSRILHRHLREGFRSLPETYAFIASSIDHLVDHCVVCETNHGLSLVRPTICESLECTTMYSRVSYRISVADMWHDPPVMNLLLTAIYATISASGVDMLDHPPFNDAASALQFLSSLPGVGNIQKALEKFMSTTPAEIASSRSPQFSSNPPPGLISGFLSAASDFWAGNAGESALLDVSNPQFKSTVLPALAWACTNYGGYLATASGPLRVPMFPQDHQFILVNTSPALEKAFAAQYIAARSVFSVLFHGTSLDRLYPILRQGLRVCSGTSLQRHGAAHGSGIYMAEEPSTSWGYARDAPGVSALKWSNIKDMRVLLGCELAGVSTASYPGIHVISDPSRLVVRYVFLMPPSAQMPLARHVEPAMRSVFANLRSRAV